MLRWYACSQPVPLACSSGWRSCRQRNLRFAIGVGPCPPAAAAGRAALPYCLNALAEISDAHTAGGDSLTQIPACAPSRQSRRNDLDHRIDDVGIELCITVTLQFLERLRRGHGKAIRTISDHRVE